MLVAGESSGCLGCYGDIRIGGFDGNGMIGNVWALAWGKDRRERMEIGGGDSRVWWLEGGFRFCCRFVFTFFNGING